MKKYHYIRELVFTGGRLVFEAKQDPDSKEILCYLVWQPDCGPLEIPKTIDQFGLFKIHKS